MKVVAPLVTLTLTPPPLPSASALLCRLVMSKLVGLDILSADLDAETDIQHPTGKPIMLAFVNVAANLEVLTREDQTALKRALTFLCNNLSDRGTVVVALPDWEFNRTKLKGLNLGQYFSICKAWRLKSRIFCIVPRSLTLTWPSPRLPPDSPKTNPSTM